MDKRATRRTRDDQQPRKPLFKSRREIFVVLFFFSVPLSFIFVIFPIYSTINPNASLQSSDNDILGRSMCLLFVFICPFGFIIYTSIYLNTRSETSCDLVDDGFVKKDLTYKDIVPITGRNLDFTPTTRHFSNQVLVYISPGVYYKGCLHCVWVNPTSFFLLGMHVNAKSSRGYELAKKFTHKFTHISPIWYELKSCGNTFCLQGRENYDTKWICELRKRGDIKVLPKFTIEALSVALIKEKKQREKVIDLIVEECMIMAYDGVVLELWSSWEDDGIIQGSIMRKKAFAFLKELANSMHNQSADGHHLDLIYVVHPPRYWLSVGDIGPADFGRDDLRSLSNDVDGFSLETYDFSSVDSPGPNAPLQWICSTLEELLRDDDKSVARKLYVGLNFHGHDYRLAKGGGNHGVQVLTDEDYRSLLEEHQPRMGWDKSCGEHYFIYLDKGLRTHLVFYPSLLSIWTRLEEAREWGVGVAIHQVEGGLDSFLGML